jgi:hypothetical protein
MGEVKKTAENMVASCRCPVFFLKVTQKNHSNITEVCFSQNISLLLSSKYSYGIQLRVPLPT